MTNDGMTNVEERYSSLGIRYSSFAPVLGVCRIRTRPCEGRRSGSIPGEDIGKVEGGVGKGEGRRNVLPSPLRPPPSPLGATLEPDGQAVVCKTT
jgi:hypothetical protein